MMKRILLSACATVALTMGSTVKAGDNGSGVQVGRASYYSDRLHGRKTASGRPYNKDDMTAAHKTLPLGSEVRVTDVKSGKSVTVRINDRGPHVKGRVIDLSRAAARELGMLKRGDVRVQIEVISRSGRLGS